MADDTYHDPSDIGIAAYELASQVMIELGWDSEKRKAVFSRTLSILEQQRPGAAAVIRSVTTI